VPLIKKFLIEHRVLLATLFLGVLAPLLIIGELAEDVWDGDGFTWDEPLLRWLYDYRTPGLDRLMLLFTQLGRPGFMFALGCIVVASLWALKRRGQAVFFVLSVGGAGILNLVAKLVFARDRPTLWVSLAPEKTFSFPSGHAMGTMAMFATLVVLSWPTRWRWPVLLVGIPFVYFVGLSRMYLGVHFPSDILAGWLASLAWVTGLYLIWQTHAMRRERLTNKNSASRAEL
jgi:undecaprenyl-diphosphatase